MQRREQMITLLKEHLACAQHRMKQLAEIHPTVHVSQLKQFRGQLPHLPYGPEWLQGGHPGNPKTPEKILARRLVKRQNKAAVQILVQWQGFPLEQATLEYVMFLSPNILNIIVEEKALKRGRH